MYFQIIDSGFIRTLALALHFSYLACTSFTQSNQHIKSIHYIQPLGIAKNVSNCIICVAVAHLLSLNDYMYRPACTSYMSWLPHHMIAIHYLHPHISWIAYMNLDTILSAAILLDELIVKKVLSPRWQEAEEIYPSTQTMMSERTFARCWYLKTTLVLFLLDLIYLLVGT